MGSSNVRCSVTDLMIIPNEQVVLHVVWGIGNQNYSLPLYAMYNDYGRFVLNDRLTDGQTLKQRIALSYLYLMFDTQIELKDRTKIRDKYPTLESFINDFEQFSEDVNLEDLYSIGGTMRYSLERNESISVDTSIKLFPVKQTVYYNIVSMDFQSRNFQRMYLDSLDKKYRETYETSPRKSLDLQSALKYSGIDVCITEVHKHYPEMWGSQEILQGTAYNIVLKHLIPMMASCRILGEFLALTGREWKYNPTTTQRENIDVQRELNSLREYELKKLDMGS